MKKCISCGKESADKGIKKCSECGGEMTDRGKKKKKIIFAAIIALLVVAVSGTFIAVNVINNGRTVSQTEKGSKDSNDQKGKTDKPEKEEADKNENIQQSESGTVSDNAVQEGESATTEAPSPDGSSENASSGGYITIPEGMSLEEIIDEFNSTTDLERKEDLRLILEELFSSAEEIQMQ